MSDIPTSNTESPDALTIEKLRAVMASVRPLARLQPSKYVTQGECYRLQASEFNEWTPTILLHPDDIDDLMSRFGIWTREALGDVLERYFQRTQPGPEPTLVRGCWPGYGSRWVIS